jgi:hypothetical protein
VVVSGTALVGEPGLGAPAASAAALRQQLALGRGKRLLDAVSESLPWIQVRFERLAAHDGRQDALMCPLAGGGFRIIIDPDLSPADIEAGRDLQEALDWRLAHELGHSFFFAPGTPPQRWARWTPAEEREADRLAAILLHGPR